MNPVAALSSSTTGIHRDLTTKHGHSRGIPPSAPHFFPQRGKTTGPPKLPEAPTKDQGYSLHCLDVRGTS